MGLGCKTPTGAKVSSGYRGLTDGAVVDGAVGTDTQTLL